MKIDCWGFKLPRPQQFDMIDFKGSGELVDRYNRRISEPTFKIAYILLRKPGYFRKLLLG